MTRSANLFADQPYAQHTGLGRRPSRSTSREAAAKSARRGVIKVSMQFMADVELVCEACGGSVSATRYSVKYRGKSIYDVLG